VSIWAALSLDVWVAGVAAVGLAVLLTVDVRRRRPEPAPVPIRALLGDAPDAHDRPAGYRGCRRAVPGRHRRTGGRRG